MSQSNLPVCRLEKAIEPDTLSRRFNLADPTTDAYTNESSEVVREWVNQNAINITGSTAVMIPRDINDDPIIVETWI